MIRSLFLFTILFSCGLQAQPPVRIVLEPFASGLSAPVDIAHAGDDRLFVVQRAGIIKIIDPNGVVSPTAFMNIQSRVNSGGSEQGLLGLTFDPDYATNGYFYVYYSFGTGNGTSRISRFSVTADPNVADPTSELIIYTQVQPASNHNGGDLDFGPDGYLYVGFGDGGSANDPLNNGQTLTNWALGDMIRLDVHNGTPYSIPASNPWATLGNDTLPEIWASGLRNPYRFGFDALTGDLWIGDVGQNAREEVDFWPAGDNSGPNFGWRCYEGDIATPGISDNCPPMSAFAAPVSVHPHTAGWCSVIGGRVYRGEAFPRLYGRYIYTDYCPAPYYSLLPDGIGGWTRELIRNAGSAGTSCIAENSALELFVANHTAGTIHRIVDQCPMTAPTISQLNDVLTSTPADSYVWYFNGAIILGQTGQSLVIDQIGSYYVIGTFNGVCDFPSDTLQVIQLGIAGNGLPLFQIFPSPARDVMSITGAPSMTTGVRLMDMTGRILLEKGLNGQKERIQLEVSGLANGNYVVALVGATGVLQQRLVSIEH